MVETSIDGKLGTQERLAPPSSIPSRTDESRAGFAQFAGTMGIVTMLVGIGVRVVNHLTSPPLFGKSETLLGLPIAVSAPWALIGLAAIFLLLHAILVKDASVRRTYGFFGYAALALGVMLTGVGLATAVGANTTATYVVGGVLGLIFSAATVVPFVRDQGLSSDEPVGGEGSAPRGELTVANFLPRWLGSLGSNKVVLQATIVSLVAAGLFLGGAYYLQHVRIVEGAAAPNLIPYGLLGLFVGTAFLFVFAHNEAAATWRDAAISVVGVMAFLAAILGIATVILDLFKLPDYALPYGLGLATIGLLGTWAFVIMQGSDTDLGHRAAWGMIVLGLFAIVVAATRSAVQDYVVPNGYLFIMLGATYAAVGAAFAIDHPLVVLTRRELTVIFYSPIGYFVLGSITLVAWMSFYLFTDALGPYGPSPAPKVQEPIIRYYFFDIFPVIFLISSVPSLTMRLLSEEKASGTIEVLLTAPVSELAVVLSKFLGAWIFFMITWAIWTFFPMTLRILANETFDYRPLLSFYAGMTFMGAAFVAMGLFFSSVTRNQIVAQLITFTAMIFLTVPYFILYGSEQRRSLSEGMMKFLEYTSYLYQMREMVSGKVHLIYVFLHLGFTLVWLVLTWIVLASRRWK